MTTIHEDDVVYAFRQAVEEEMRRLQDENASAEPILKPGASAEDNLARLAQSHAQLQAEVALMRTIVLKLMSQPVDTSDNAGA